MQHDSDLWPQLWELQMMFWLQSRVPLACQCFQAIPGQQLCKMWARNAMDGEGIWRRCQLSSKACSEGKVILGQNRGGWIALSCLLTFCIFQLYRRITDLNLLMLKLNATYSPSLFFLVSEINRSAKPATRNLKNLIEVNSSVNYVYWNQQNQCH